MKSRIVKLKEIIIVFCIFNIFTSGAKAEGFGLF